MKAGTVYTTQLVQGLGLIQETNLLLDYWEPSMSATDLYKLTLETGAFPKVSARRLRNIVVECFSPRYLREQPEAAVYLKQLKDSITPAELNQLYFLYTCRANQILADFVRDVYWDRYQSGGNSIENYHATDFINSAMEEGKTSKRWSETVVKQYGSRLVGACRDYGLLGSVAQGRRQIVPYRLEEKVATFLAHDIHFQGFNDDALLQHEDWGLFGLEGADVLDEFKRMSLLGHLIFQSAASVTRISWHYNNMQEVIDVLAQS
jgi:hypothetical protein